MKYYYPCLFAFLATLLLSCSSSVSTDPLLEKAYTQHQLAMSIHDSVISKLDTLNRLFENIEMKDTLAKNHLQVLELLEKDFELWDESLVSVPGYESEHDHNHEHEHDHHSQDELKDMSPEQILELQKGLKMEIARIHDKADSIISIISELKIE